MIHDKMEQIIKDGGNMQGIAGSLIIFFIACWVLVLGHLFGPPLFDANFFQASLPIAYTGAIISVAVSAVAVTAIVLRR